jgi:uncharacterized damage-inducible protein DinB
METKQTAGFSRAVRGSTLKRLKAVPEGMENWRISSNAMSFADVAQHLIDADTWLLRKLKGADLVPIQGQAGSVNIAKRAEYIAIIDELREIGTKRGIQIEGLTDAMLRGKMFDARFDGEVSVWWIIVRGNLDHETHHRGQLAAYLRALKDAGHKNLV